MSIKLFDSEIKVMEILWELGEVQANVITKRLKDDIGWNINTTYTVINKLEQKGALRKQVVGLRKTLCYALISQEDVQTAELDELVNRFFSGSSVGLFSALANREDLPKDVIEKLRATIEELR
ncbi:MAG: BlaI/MecI/CopY family transcriptional regulator [Christensenellaceae bacterium]